MMIFLCTSRVVSGTEQRIAPFLPWISSKATPVLTALAPEIDCNQTALGFRPVTYAVFHIAIILKRWRLRGISEISLLLLQGLSVSGIFVCM
jgi:hypothetical protein